MRLYSITPVQTLHKGKSRLSPLLNPSQRDQLSRKMLNVVLSTIQASKAIEGMIVVSPDEEVMKIASDFGAYGLKEEREAGVNAAVRKGLDFAIENHADAIVVLPGDLPLLTTEDLINLVDEVTSEPTVVITPSNRLDGTNALLMKPPNIMEFHYDQDSFRSHFLEAVEHEVRLKTVLRKGLMTDLDDGMDLKEFIGSDYDSGVKTYLVSLSLP